MEPVKTGAGLLTVQPYDDGIAKGVQILIDGIIVCAVDVYNKDLGVPMAGEARVLIYSMDKDVDEPLDCIKLN